MAASRKRLVHVFIWKEGLAPDLTYARRLLNVLSPEAAQLAAVPNPPLRLYSVTGSWPENPWTRAIEDIRTTPAPNGTNWTDSSRYELTGWRGASRSDGSRVFIVSAYLRESEGPAATVRTPHLEPDKAYIALRAAPDTGEIASFARGGDDREPEAGPLQYQPKAVPAALRLPTTPPMTHETASYDRYYVGLGPRLGAALIDLVAAGILAAGVVAILLAASGSPIPSDFWGWLARVTPLACTGLAVFALYNVIQWTIAGTTAGKFVVGIQIVDTTGHKPGFGRSLLRMLGYIFSLTAGGWGVVMIALDPFRQALHDKIAGTYLIPNPPPSNVPDGLPGYAKHGSTAPEVRTTVPRLPVLEDDDQENYNMTAAAIGPTSNYGIVAVSSLPAGSGAVDEGSTGTTRTDLSDFLSGPFAESRTPSSPREPGQTQTVSGAARALFKSAMSEMERGVVPTSRGYRVETYAARNAATLFRESLDLVPASVVYRYFYAVALRYSEGFDVAMGELRRVLEQDATHFEAKQQVAYGPRWHDSFAYPAWVAPAPVEIDAPLPLSVAALLPPGNLAATRLVLLREGGTKLVAFLSRTPRTAWNRPPNAEMPTRLKLLLSRTAYGPIVALYVIVEDDGANPYVGETFLNPHDLGAPSDDACQLGQNVLAQLARQDRTYLIFADEDNRLLLSRKLMFDAPAQVEIARLLYEVQTLPPQVIEPERFRQAAQWHMDHFSLDQVKDP